MIFELEVWTSRSCHEEGLVSLEKGRTALGEMRVLEGKALALDEVLGRG